MCHAEVDHFDILENITLTAWWTWERIKKGNMKIKKKEKNIYL